MKLSEKTKVNFSTAALAGMLIFTIGTTYGLSSKITTYEIREQDKEMRITAIEQDVQTLKDQRIEERERMIKIESDVSWIRSSMEQAE